MRWLVVVTFLAGCLPSTHQIPRSELLRLAETPPAERGDHVRVVQDLVGEAPPAAEPVTDETVIIVPDVEVDVTPQHPAPAPRPHGGKVPPLPSVSNDSAKEAWAIFIVAAAVGVTLSVTEGTRYDGWVRMHPMMPVHLWGPGGYEVVPLAQIDPATAAWATRAVVVPSEGPWHPLGRAPFDRVGFTYSVMVGSGQLVATDGSRDLGTTGRVQFGYFFVHPFGLQIDWGFGFRNDRIGSTLFHSRLGVEGTFAPLDAGPLHAGVFAGLDVADRLEDRVAGGRARGTGLTGGALLQLSATTRLAFDARLALDRAFGATTSALLLGLSVY